MGKAVSNDLRLRMVRGIAAGRSRREVAAQFEVAAFDGGAHSGPLCGHRFGGPARQGRPSGSGKLGPYRDALIAKVKAEPDITMADLAAWLEAEHGVTADPSNLSKLLCKAGFSYKKNASGLRERTL